MLLRNVSESTERGQTTALNSKARATPKRNQSDARATLERRLTPKRIQSYTGVEPERRLSNNGLTPKPNLNAPEQQRLNSKTEATPKRFLIERTPTPESRKATGTP
jgi:hypothetical protein